MSNEAESVFAQLRQADENIARLIAEGGDKDPETRQRELLAQEDKRRVLSERLDMQWVLADARGRRTIRRILEAAQPYALSYVKGDTHETALNEGQRKVGLAVIDMIAAAEPSAYSQMMRERASDEKVERERRAKLREKIA